LAVNEIKTKSQGRNKRCMIRPSPLISKNLEILL
jgi:hypothetical protein